jgi:ribonuclease HI
MISPNRHLLALNFDGSISKPNPGGFAAWGAHLSDNGEVVWEGSGPIGRGPDMSNNYAEFFALAKGLEKVNEIISSNPEDKYSLLVRGDSDLVIHIMNKEWRPNDSKLYFPAYELAAKEFKAIRSKGVAVNFDWIPRENNTKADELSRWQQWQ